MRISDIIQIGREYLILGITGVLVAGGLLAIGYLLVYRKIMKGTKKLKIRQLLLWGLLFCYLVVVLGATFGIRGSMYTGKPNLQPFGSYREAWNEFSVSGWRNLVLNILMFVPLGFLLPLVNDKCRKWWVTYGIGLVAAVLIEVVQYTTKRGIFEIDDIINNAVGTMIGFGIISLVLALYAEVRKRESLIHYKVVIIGILQLPLLIAVAAFLIIFSVYQRKELGNMGIAYYERQNMSNIAVTANRMYSKERGEATVYKAVYGTRAESLQTANDFLAYFGTSVDESETDAYNDTVVYRSQDGERIIWVYDLGLTIRFTDFTKFDEAGETGLNLAEVALVLDKYGITIPPEAQFEEIENANYEITVSMADMGGYYLDGTLSCRIVEGEVAEIHNMMIRLEPYKEYPVISEQEAYEQILAGRFRMDGDVEAVVLDKAQMSYRMDSKGYYQPIYEFYGTETINGMAGVTTISIPAILPE